ncbi:MAG: citrate/2-methylcitrate synthase [Candidatus Omnitrophica bacterium]|nr:citrate/2-methylcitrate synthase [Candidatus Omnitrophota bacterium]
MHEQTQEITEIILKAKERAVKETGNEPEPELTKALSWPINCTVGPGLEGAIACETKIGYVNGAKGWLIYRGYNIFDLCAYSTFEEVSYLLMYGYLPSESQLSSFKKKLVQYRQMHHTKRLLMSFPIEKMHPMAGLRLGTTLMRQEFTDVDRENYTSNLVKIISADEDSIPMETKPMGEEKAIYEFKQSQREKIIADDLKQASGFESCFHLLAGVATLTGAISRLRQGAMPIENDESLSFAGNLIYTMTGKRPTPTEERIMDVSLILHADHGMNASTFASMVVASTLSDVYLSVGAGIAALQGPLHGGANERVIEMLNEIGSVDNVKSWFEKKRAKKEKIMGFGHRVYKAYDPRAMVLGPLAKFMTKNSNNGKKLFKVAQALEKEVISTLGKEKRIFPNVDFYSGIVYAAMGITAEFYTPIFAVSRVAGWTSRVQEYMCNNRIFRPRAMYTGPFDKEFTPINQRGVSKKSK